MSRFHRFIASMEPCLFRHGKEKYRPQTFEDYIGLQWSHVFSDMVRLRKQFNSLLLFMLQWSHVFSDMVSDYKTGKYRESDYASMEPCLFRHGKILTVQSAYHCKGASMEPCLFRHGKQYSRMGIVW